MQALSRHLGRVPAGWIVLLVLPALAPLARGGFFESHDGLFHAYRLAALDRAVRAGVLYPRWFPELGFGYGQPVLNFYGPLSYFWGLPFTLPGFDAATALELVFATGLVASALAMYRFARLHLGPGASAVAAVVYAFLPYHLVDLYVRGAVAEYLAFVWFPLILWSWHRLVEEDAGDWRFGTARVGSAALSVVALLLTHSLSLLIFSPVLAGYVVLLWFRHRGRPQLARVVMAALLALALGAFYWLPVLAEAGYVGLGHGSSQGYADHLLPGTELVSWNLAYPYPLEGGEAPVFTLGLVQVTLMLASLALPFLLREGRGMIGMWLVVAWGSAAMLTTASLPVWRAFERGLAFLQYPWRFQALSCLATAFLAGVLVRGLGGDSRWKKVALGGLILVLTGLWALWRLPLMTSRPDLSEKAMWELDRTNGQVGTTWTGEYLPIWVQEQRWALSLPREEPDLARQPAAPAEFVLTGLGYNRYEFASNAPGGSALVLHQFYYPGWEAVDRSSGRRYEAQPVGELGLAGFDLPAGAGSLAVRLGLTSAQWWGTLVSFLVALGLGGLLVSQQLSRGRSAVRIEPGSGAPPAAGGAVLLAAVLLSSLTLPHGAVRHVRQVGANLEDTAELLSFATDGDSYRPGDTVGVTLYWRALRGIDLNLKSFVHLTATESGVPMAQHDGDPGGGFTPTSRWLPGEVVPDGHSLRLPKDLAPGRYLLWAGLYEYEPVRNLRVVSAEFLATEGRVWLGEIEVVAP